MGSRTQNAKRNIFTGIISRLITLALPFITRTCIIHYLGTIYLGLNGLFTSILQILSLAELGFGEAMVFSMYKPLAEHDDAKIRALLNLYKKIYRYIGLFVLMIGMVILPILPHLIREGYPSGIKVNLLYFIYLLNTVLSYWLYAYKSSLLSATQESSINNTINIVVQLILSIFQIIIIVSTKNYYIYVLAIPISTIIRNVLTDVISKRKYPNLYCDGKIEKQEVKEIEKRVAGLFIYKICGTFRNSFDSIVISAFLGLTILAKYENYLYITNSIVAILTIISNSITAGVGNSLAKETIEKNYSDFKNFYFIYVCISTWCTACLLCIFPPFMELWVGKELSLNMSVVVMMSLYFYVLKTGDMCYVYRQAAGIWWKDKFRPIVEAFSNLALNVLLVKAFGVVGVQLATVVTMVFINFIWGAKILFDSYFKKSPGEYFLKTLFYSFITLLVCLLSNYLCNIISIDNLYITVCVRLFICTAISLAFIFLSYRGLPEYNNSINIFKRVLRKT